MSFLYNLTHKINTHKKSCLIDRKENRDSLTTIKRNPLIIYKKERASAFTSKGSITLEAAIVVPIFFFAMLCLAYLLELMAIQTTMRNALYSAGKQFAQEAYVERIVTPHEIEQQIIANVGVQRLEQSIIVGGAEGIHCSQSVFHWNTGVMDLSVQYEVEIPIPMFRLLPLSYSESIRVKGWTGYAAGAYETTRENMVYVTDTGMVYHRDENCTYLDMSVHSASAENIDELRNQSGGKYYACESCDTEGANSSIYYITDYGTRYHTSLECRKIKRNIYAIPIKEAYGLGGCSKCVK